MNRKRSREIAMELLFGMTLSKNTLEETLENFIEDYGMDIKKIDLEYIKNILKNIQDNMEVIDGKIEDALSNWKLDRISKVNLTILRLAVGEMLFLDDVPSKVAINEAIEITKKYSDDKSVSFINGVLDKTFKSI